LLLTYIVLSDKDIHLAINRIRTKPPFRGVAGSDFPVLENPGSLRRLFFRRATTEVSTAEMRRQLRKLLAS
jgi:hypothetical protein